LQFCDKKAVKKFGKSLFGGGKGRTFASAFAKKQKSLSAGIVL